MKVLPFPIKNLKNTCLKYSPERLVIIKRNRLKFHSRPKKCARTYSMLPLNFPYFSELWMQKNDNKTQVWMVSSYLTELWCEMDFSFYPIDTQVISISNLSNNCTNNCVLISSPQPVMSQPYPVPIPLPQPKSRPLPDSRGIPDTLNLFFFGKH